MATPTSPLGWTPFECDGHTFEYAKIPTKVQTRPAGWPAHKASPHARLPHVMVCVRKVGDKTGPGMLYPEGTVVRIEHVLETARRFWSDLTR